MGIDRKTIDAFKAMIPELIVGLEYNYDPIYKRVCMMHDTDGVAKGFMPFFNETVEIPDAIDQNADDTCVRYCDFDFDDIEFDTKARMKGFELTKKEMRNLKKILVNYPLMEKRLRKIKDSCEAGVDLQLLSGLTDVALNETNAIGTPWDDAAATPLVDITDFIDTQLKTIQTDMNNVIIIAGHRTMRSLQFSDDLKAGVSNYANDGMLPAAATGAALANQLDIPSGNVFKASSIFNSRAANNLGEIVPTFNYEDLFWIGVKPALHFFSDGDGDFENWYDYECKKLKGSFDRCDQAKRAEKSKGLGGFLTNLHT